MIKSRAKSRFILSPSKENPTTSFTCAKIRKAPHQIRRGTRFSAAFAFGSPIKFGHPWFDSPTTIYVRVTIDETGKVIGAKSLWTTHPADAAEAETAAKATRFEPSIVCGQPSKISLVLDFSGGGR